MKPKSKRLKPISREEVIDIIQRNISNYHEKCQNNIASYIANYHEKCQNNIASYHEKLQNNISDYAQNVVQSTAAMSKTSVDTAVRLDKYAIASSVLIMRKTLIRAMTPIRVYLDIAQLLFISMVFILLIMDVFLPENMYENFSYDIQNYILTVFITITWVLFILRRFVIDKLYNIAEKTLTEEYDDIKQELKTDKN